MSCLAPPALRRTRFEYSEEVEAGASFLGLPGIQSCNLHTELNHSQSFLRSLSKTIYTASGFRRRLARGQ